MKYLMLSLFIIVSAAAKAQEGDAGKHSFTYVEQMPAPEFKLGEYLGENIKYPDSARKYNITGRVIVQFVVEKDGSITHCKILRGIGGGCDEEALRVIKNMPNWKPGKNDGKPVSVLFTQPITFSLTDDKDTPKPGIGTGGR